MLPLISCFLFTTVIARSLSRRHSVASLSSLGRYMRSVSLLAASCCVWAARLHRTHRMPSTSKRASLAIARLVSPIVYAFVAYAELRPRNHRARCRPANARPTLWRPLYPTGRLLTPRHGTCPGFCLGPIKGRWRASCRLGCRGQCTRPTRPMRRSYRYCPLGHRSRSCRSCRAPG